MSRAFGFQWDDRKCSKRLRYVCQGPDWAAWSSCTVTCGGGRMKRCDTYNTEVIYTIDCEEKDCGTIACPLPELPTMIPDLDYEEDEAGQAGIISGVVIFGVIVLAGTIAGVVYYLKKKKSK